MKDVVVRPFLGDSLCERRIITQIFPLPPFCTEQMAYQNCHHNISYAIAKRHYTDTPPVTLYGRGELQRGYRMFKRWCMRCGLFPGVVEPFTPQEVISSRRSKRFVYERAFESLEKEPIHKSDFRGRAFVKFEKAERETITEKIPRLVQYRETLPASRALATLACYFAALEKRLYRIQCNGRPIFAKYLDTHQRAELIASFFEPGVVVLGMDHSRFDSHVLGELRSIEWRFYLWAFKNSPELARIMAWTATNDIVIRDVMRLKAPARRMSGDYNTSLGNNIVNVVSLLAFISNLGGDLDKPGFAILLDGDDSVVAIPRSQLHNADMSYFREIGLTTKLEDVASIPAEIQFCQSRPVKTYDGWYMMRDFRRTISRMCYTIRTYKGASWYKYARGVLDAEWAVSHATPIIGPLVGVMRAQLGAGDTITDPDYEHKLLTAAQPAYIDPICRTSYDETFGISATAQLELERSFSNTDWMVVLRDLVLGPG